MIAARIAVVALASTLAGCAACGNDRATPKDAGPDAYVDERTWDQCDGDPAAFVRHAFLALDGRRPRSQAEVDVYVDLYARAAEQGLAAPEVVARAIMSRPEFDERWIDLAMDALHVQRLDYQSESNCWDQSVRAAVGPELARAVRDRAATEAADGPFTMLDLARSAIALDDLTPLYRAQLFSLVSHPVPAANVPPIEAELARRADFGARFDASYLHRDAVCLGCHTSDRSVTDSDDPARDRHWPVPGAPEHAVYGVLDDASSQRAHAVFRVASFVGTGSTRPWGWAPSCGRFAAPTAIGDDPAGIDAKLGAITGSRPTVFAVEQALARGFAALRASGAPTGELADPDAALAWLVTLKMTEDVWRQATGTQLTISNYFPRNEAASQLLYALAQRYVASGFSLRALLVAIVSSDYFARLPPDAGCGQEPYAYPNVFDPWVTAEGDPAMRHNSPGDAVTAIDARTLISAAAAALEWPPAPSASRFPEYGEGCEDLPCSFIGDLCVEQGFCCMTHEVACMGNGVEPWLEVPFQRAIGTFLRNSERGFRGLDFQARLAWEDRYGACARPRWVTEDFVDRLAAAGAADPSATARELVAALKDRLIGEPSIADGPEAEAIAAITGALDGPASGVGAERLRRVCGALLGAPQFLLQGIAGRGGERPRLTPESADYPAMCNELATHGLGVAGWVVGCAEGALTLAPGLAAP